MLLQEIKMSDENVLSLDGKSYKEEELTDEQKYYKEQITDLQNKIVRVKFELDQLSASQSHFRNLLVNSLKKTMDSIENSKDSKSKSQNVG
tara:strand:+ start:1299 stop:1571 length:273 start_codon:yes stop_codon:yes gene_type:complete